MRKQLLCIFATLFLLLVSGFAAADQLEITDIIVKVDDDKQSADEGGGSIDILPDSTLSLKIEVKNTYDDDDIEGTEIENIEIEAILEEIDDGDDLEEVSDDFDLRADRDKTITLEFPIPLRLETDETFKLTVTVTGEDKNGTDHKDEVEFDVDVDKEKHEIRFMRSELSPEKIKCEGSTNVQLRLINTGEEDEDVELIIDAPSLDFSKREEFELVEDIDDDDNEFETTEKITVNKDVGAGTYEVKVMVNYNDDRDSVDEVLNLVVEACAATTPPPAPTPEPTPTPKPEPKEEETTVEVVTQPQVTTPTTSPYVRPSTAVATPRTSYSNQGDSWWSENKWLAIILITDLVLIIAGIIVVVTILKKRRA